MTGAVLLTEDMKDFVRLLERHRVDYAVVGGFAVNYHGYPRLTQDFDILVRGTIENGRRISASLGDFGFGGVGLDARFFARSGVVVHLGAEPNRIDLLTTLRGVEVSVLFSNRIRVCVEDIEMWMISLEDLIASKRASKRLRDLADAEELERRSAD